MTSNVNVVHAPSEAQVKYVRALQRKLHLSDRLLDGYCEHDRFGRRFADLERSQVSQLIDEMVGWEGALPAALIRRKGQQDLPGLDGGR